MNFSPLTPWGFLATELHWRVARARNTSERGASTIEWVIITGILVAIAVAVGLVIYNMVTKQAASINIPAAPGGGGAGGGGGP